MPSSRFCTHCGTPASDGKFCTNCGQPLNNEEPLEDQPAQAGSDAAAAAAHNGGAAQVVVGAAAGAAATAQAVPATLSAAPAAQPPGAPDSAPATPPPPAPPQTPQAAAPAPSGGSGVPWPALALSALAVVILAGIVAVVLIAAGGSPSSTPSASKVASQKVQLTTAMLASRSLYTTSQHASYSALLPAGWQPVTASSTALTDAATVQNPVDTATTITVGRVAKPSKTLAADARALFAALSAGASVSSQQSQATTLAGGRAAWVFGYSTGASSVAYYLLQSCKNTYAVGASTPTSHASVIRLRLQIAANTLQGNC